MAFFGLNWEESKWPGHFCSIVLYFFASKIGVKLPPEKKVPWHRRWAALSWWSNCHFCQKNTFFGQKKAFFQEVHFIQKCSVTQNTIFQCFKKVFFTILNLLITLDRTEYLLSNTRHGYTSVQSVQMHLSSEMIKHGRYLHCSVSSSSGMCIYLNNKLIKYSPLLWQKKPTSHQVDSSTITPL